LQFVFLQLLLINLLIIQLWAEAKISINYDIVHDLINKYTGAPAKTHESVCLSAVKTASYIHAALIIVITENGLTARLVAKYTPKS